MIQIYSVDNTEYDKNGDMVLFPNVCKCTAILKDTWSLVMEHPVDAEGRWKYINEEAVISVKTFMPEQQLFRIYKVDKTDSYITVTAYPIFYDSAKEVFLVDVRPTLKNAQEALDILTSGTKYSGISDISKVSTAYQIRKNLLNALNGSEEESFINRWGGEPLYDNYNAVFNKRAGGDYGVEIRYGKNIASINETIDMSGIITRIIPVSYNGYTLSGAEPWVDSPLIAVYATVYAREVKFEDVKLVEDAGEDEESFLTIDDLRNELIRRSELMFSEGEVDKPGVTLDVEMVDLANTDEYKDYKVLEEVGIGDTIHCVHNKLGVDTKARIIEVVWDCIKHRPESLKIGNVTYNYFRSVTNAAKAIDSVIDPTTNKVMADKIAGIIDASVTQLRLQADIAKKVEYRAILIEDLDQDSPTFGAICFGTKGWEIASKRTEDGKGWDWTTAATANGIIADVIVTGLLSDRLGKNYWNLDTGEFRLTMDNVYFDDETAREYVAEAVGKEVDKSRVINLILSNEFHAVPTDSTGSNGNYAGCECTLKVFWGDTDITNDSEISYSAVASSGVVGSFNLANRRYTVINMTTDTGYVDFTASYLDLSITRRFDISKNKAGMDGTNGVNGTDGRVYMIEASTVTITKGLDDTITPEAVTFYSYYRNGQSATRTDYEGRFVIQESSDGSTWTTKYTSDVNESSKTYTPSKDIKMIQCTLYAADGTTNAIDRQTVNILTDISNLTQEITFNKLTDNGRIKGIYMENGELYINFTYAKGGTLKLGGDNDANGLLQLLDAAGNTITTLDRNGLTTSSAKITGGSIDISPTSGMTQVIKLGYSDIYRTMLLPAGLYVTQNSSGVITRTRINGAEVVLGRASSGTIDSPAITQRIAMDADSGRIDCVTLSQSSDRKLKKDIEDLESKFAKEFILGLNPVLYKFKEGDSDKHLGFIAQDIQNIIDSEYAIVKEEQIKDDTTSPMGVIYTEIIAPLVKLVQEQEKRLSELERRAENSEVD